MNPYWRSHRIGGARLRRVWRLPCGTEIRGTVDHQVWGRVVSAATLPALGRPPWETPRRMDVMLTVEAWLPFGTCLPPVVIAEPTVHPYHELSRLDARAAAYTRVPVRRVERGLVIERTT